MKKRIITLLLVLAMIVSAAPMALAMPGVVVFGVEFTVSVKGQPSGTTELNLWTGEEISLESTRSNALDHSGYGQPTDVWLISATSDPKDGQIIAAAGNDTAYTFTQDVVGTFYYFFGQLREKTDDPDIKQLSCSNAIKVTTTKPGATLSIKTQPEDVTCAVGEAVTLKCEAVTSDGSAVLYQWFATNAKGDGGTKLPGETKETFTPDTSAVGTSWYFCKAQGADTFLDTNTIKVIVGGALPETESYIFPFTDVADGQWYRQDVENAHKKGLIDGLTATTYCPDDSITVAQTIKLAACMNQLYQNGSVSLRNGDIDWYSSYVNYALLNSIIKAEYSDYNEEITRAEFVHIFYAAMPESEYAAKNDVADGSIPDVTADSQYADEIYAFYRAGILTGGTSGEFMPESTIKRSEVAAIVSRMYDKDARK